MPDTTILILAAGASRRMGGADKLLAQIDGVPLLRRQALAALATSAPVRVALPLDRPARVAALEGLAVEQVSVPDAALGLSASLRAGVAGLAGSVMILPADMPEINTKMMAQILAKHSEMPGMILRGSAAETPGHPVLFPADLVSALRGLRGDTGARDLLRSHQARLRLVPLPGSAALTDLDTPEDWAEWRARTGMRDET